MPRECCGCLAGALSRQALPWAAPASLQMRCALPPPHAQVLFALIINAVGTVNSVPQVR